MKLSFALLVLAFHLQSNGVNASGKCSRSGDYKCGNFRGAAPYWPATTTCTWNQCCCHDDKGWEQSTLAYQLKTCEGQDSSVIGCFACSGQDACKNLDNTHVGDSSCNGDGACKDSDGVIIGISSCNKYYACSQAAGTIIGNGSCNAESICIECEDGSVVPDGTCNDVTNDDEVGTLEEEACIMLACSTIKTNRCRACFVSTFHYLYLSNISFL